MKKHILGLMFFLLCCPGFSNADTVSICEAQACYVVGATIQKIEGFYEEVESGGVSSERKFRVHQWNQGGREWQDVVCPEGNGEYEVPAKVADGDFYDAMLAGVTAAFYADLPIALTVDQATCEVHAVQLRPRLSEHEYGASKNTGVTVP